MIVCAIAKNENLYIREFVEHYKNIGVEKIILYDNNEINGETFDNILNDFISDGFVEIINKRGLTAKYFGDSIQMRSYNECYAKYGKASDWIGFFDVDEYLMLPNGFENVHDWLSESIFSNYKMIHINWKYFGDNGLLHYENKPLNERFTVPCMPSSPENFFENRHIKTIARGNVYGLLFCSTPHTPLTWVSCCDVYGNKIENSFSPFNKPVYNENGAYLKHFGTKTIEEYITVKMKRGFPDQPIEEALKRINIQEFFKRNEYTEEKMELAKKLIENEYTALRNSQK